MHAVESLQLNKVAALRMAISLLLQVTYVSHHCFVRGNPTMKLYENKYL